VIADPLSATTRTERRWLLVSSFALLALSWGGLTPTSVDAFGVQVGATRPAVLVGLTLAVTVYFLCAFIFYYRSDQFATDQDFRRLQIATAEEIRTAIGELVGIPGLNDHKLQTMSEDIARSAFKKFLRARYRFEFLSAVGIGVGSISAGVAWLLGR
jgi:hypothetical protein